MTTPSSPSSNVKWFVLIGLLGVILIQYMEYQDKSRYQKTMALLLSITPQQVTTFKMRADTSSSYDDNKVIEFNPEAELVVDFFQALADNRPYQPEHDRGLAHWGIQIQTGTTIITIWFYIPVDKPGLVVGNIDAGTGLNSGLFQSYLLRDWYKKYKDRWLTTTAPQPGAATTPTPP